MKRVVENYTWEGEKIKGSRFIVNIAPTNSHEGARTFVQEIAKEYKDARHHCYAYRLSSGEERSSDDGEPRGSSGPPIMQRMIGLEFIDSIVVVTRYFGGVKLGIGGLIRAYGGAAASALSCVAFKEISLKSAVSVSCVYADEGRIKGSVVQYGAEIISQRYQEDVQFEIAVEQELVEGLIESIQNRSAGRARCTLM